MGREAVPVHVEQVVHLGLTTDPVKCFGNRIVAGPDRHQGVYLALGLPEVPELYRVQHPRPGRVLGAGPVGRAAAAAVGLVRILVHHGAVRRRRRGGGRAGRAFRVAGLRLGLGLGVRLLAVGLAAAASALR